MPSALISRPSASYPTEREGGRDKRRNSPSVFLPLSFPLWAVLMTDQLEIEKVTADELRALALEFLCEPTIDGSVLVPLTDRQRFLVAESLKLVERLKRNHPEAFLLCGKT